MAGDEEGECSCFTRNSPDPYFKCLMCDKSVCLKCNIVKNLEEEGTRRHKNCFPQEVQNKNISEESSSSSTDQHSSTDKVESSTSKDTSVKQSSSSMIISPESASDHMSHPSSALDLDESDEEQNVGDKEKGEISNDNSTKKSAKNPDSRSTRFEPEELKKSKHSNKERSFDPFPENKAAKKLSATASYSSISGAEKTVSSTLGSVYARTAATQASNPETKLKVSYQLKARYEYENGQVIFKKLTYGDTDFDDNDEERDFKDIEWPTDIKKTVNKIKKESRGRTQSIKTQNVKENSSKTIEVKDSDNEEKSQDSPLVVATPARRKNVNPAISVTPNNAVRAPYSRASGQSSSVNVAPSKTRKKIFGKTKPDNKTADKKNTAKGKSKAADTANEAVDENDPDWKKSGSEYSEIESDDSKTAEKQSKGKGKRKSDLGKGKKKDTKKSKASESDIESIDDNDTDSKKRKRKSKASESDIESDNDPDSKKRKRKTLGLGKGRGGFIK